MIFNSWIFVVFFVGVYTVYLRLGHRAQNRFLLAASYTFYAVWDWRFLGLILLSTAVDFHVGRSMARATEARHRRFFLLVSLVVNLGLLGFFKYAGFFVESMASLIGSFGFEPHLGTLTVVLPIGISFYTFQSLSYTIDIYRRQLEPCARFADFALFVAFFPQLVAGPIERARRLIAQVERPRVLEPPALAEGLRLVVEGFFLKLVVADNAALLVDRAFAESDPSGATALVGVYAFALQIYGDFAGYSRIARGISRLMGFELVVNFHQPYLALGPSDFWRRWHVSLSSWLRDYLYIPLGGNRSGSVTTLRNLLLTMILGGLWHGAAWTFVVWGAFHGLLLVGYRLWPLEVPSSRLLEGLSRPFRLVLWFHLTCLGWLIFRADGLAQVWSMLSALGEGVELADGRFVTLLLLALPVVVIDLFHELRRKRAADPATAGSGRTLAMVLRWATLVAMVAVIFLCGARGGQEFIYFQF